jgi:glutathione peroxidase
MGRRVLAAPRVVKSSRWAILARPEQSTTSQEIHQGGAVSLYDIPINRLDGTSSSLADFEGKAVLVVNVASKCGLTPQYETLEKLQQQYGDQGFSVVGFPSNEFLGQEPGTPEEIQEFCSVTYGVSFPLMEKIEVNGENRHPIYAELTAATDAAGEAGDIQWNFEKFLLSPTGEVVGRFRPTVSPDAPEIVGAIEANLPG